MLDRKYILRSVELNGKGVFMLSLATYRSVSKPSNNLGTKIIIICVKFKGVFSTSLFNKEHTTPVLFYLSNFNFLLVIFNR